MPDNENEKTPKDDDKPDDDTTKTPEKKEEKQTGEDDSKDDSEATKLREMIREEIRTLFNDESGRGSLRRVDLESQADKLVETAVARLNAKNEHDAEHQRLREHDTSHEPAPESEKTPIKTSRLRKALWGAE